MKRLVGRFLAVSILLLMLVVGGSAAYAYGSSAAPTPAALTALQGSPAVQVNEQNGWLVFTSTQPTPTGFIFYPGGLVDPRAYAPLALEIAEAGFVVVIPPMPLNLAVFAPEVADEIRAFYPAVSQWVIGGHSLGGTMAAQYAYERPEQMVGLVLWASYPAGETKPPAGLRALSLYGTQDGLIPLSEIEASAALLPAATQFVAINGGNHAQFGFYGVQEGDQPAGISPEEQKGLAVAATVEFLRQFGK